MTFVQVCQEGLKCFIEPILLYLNFYPFSLTIVEADELQADVLIVRVSFRQEAHLELVGVRRSLLDGEGRGEEGGLVLGPGQQVAEVVYDPDVFSAHRPPGGPAEGGGVVIVVDPAAAAGPGRAEAPECVLGELGHAKQIGRVRFGHDHRDARISRCNPLLEEDPGNCLGSGNTNLLKNFSSRKKNLEVNLFFYFFIY